MTPEPLINKLKEQMKYWVEDIYKLDQNNNPIDKHIHTQRVTKGFIRNNVKSAVDGLIKFHEDRIKELIKELETTKFKVRNLQHALIKQSLIDAINRDYVSIMAIEYWLGDVV